MEVSHEDLEVEEDVVSEEEPDLAQEEELRTAPWFQSGVPRDVSLEALLREPEGAFVVRESHSQGQSGLALSVRVPHDFYPGGIAHYLIIRAAKGFRIKVCKRNQIKCQCLILPSLSSGLSEAVP